MFFLREHGLPAMVISIFPQSEITTSRYAANAFLNLGFNLLVLTIGCVRSPSSPSSSAMIVLFEKRP
jgi:hypothetical protein